MNYSRRDEEYPYNLLFDIGIEDICNSENNIKDNLYEVLKTLSQREQTVLSELYEKHLKLREVGETYKVTPERVRQIQHKALRKLRNPQRSKYIKYGKLIDSYENLKQEVLKLERRIEEINSYIMWSCDTFGVPCKTVGADGAIPLQYKDVKIDELDLSVRAYNCLIRNGIKTLEDISNLSIEKLKRMRNLGRKTEDEILRKAREHGIIIE